MVSSFVCFPDRRIHVVLLHYIDTTGESRLSNSCQTENLTEYKKNTIRKAQYG
jgi:hypothetical protein